MREFITKNFNFLIVAILIVIIFLQKCEGGSVTKINTYDTVTTIQYHYFKDTTLAKPKIIYSSRDTTMENNYYQSSDDINELKADIQNLKEELFSKNVYRDTYKVDTFGTIEVTDTVQRNNIFNRRYINNLKIPEKTITVTNTIYPKPKSQLYFGGGISGNQVQPVQNFSVGALFKNRKDQMYGVSVGINTSGTITYGVSSFWKIKFK